MSIRALTFPTKRLSAFLTSSGAVLKINNANHWDGVALSAGELGTVIYATLRNESNTQLEIIELDASTVALLATTGATITKRACGYTGGTTASAETAYNWPANETLVELGTHPPQLFENLVDLDEAQTIDAIKTFTVAGRPRMISDVDAVANEELVTLGQLNRLGTGTTVTNRVVLSGTAGETIAAGQLVYFQTSTQRWRLVDADLPTTSDRTLQLGIAQGAGTTGNGISNGVLIYGEGIALSGLTAGARYYASGTAGAIVASVPGSVERFVGIAITTTRFFFCPNDLSDNFWIGIAGGSIFVAQVAYQRSSDGKWLSASANAASTSVGMPVGFVEVDATVGQAAIIRKSGTHMGFAGGTPGANYYITNSTGVSGTTPGTFFRHVAVADANGRLMVVDSMNVYAIDQTGQQIYAASSNGTDSYTVSMNPTLKGYYNGLTLSIKPDVGSTGTASLNVDGLGAVSLVLGLDTPVGTGDIRANHILKVMYNSTGPVFQILNGTRPADIQDFAASGTWTKPTGAKSVRVVVVGAGGGGGSGVGVNGGDGAGGGGGGGGAVVLGEFVASELGSTETITVGTGGTGGAGTVRGSAGNAGTAGGPSSFGTWLKAGGGGGGLPGAGATGGVGGGSGSAINSASGQTAGVPTAAGAVGIAGQGANGGAANTQGFSCEFGGGSGAGGGNTAGGAAGGSSIYGAGGGGGGAGGGNTASGGAGGTCQSYAVGGGGAGAANAGAPGSNGATNASLARGYGGSGAGGGGVTGSGLNASASSGGVGGAPGGGGGGGAGFRNDTTANTSGSGGNGGVGVVRVITFF